MLTLASVALVFGAGFLILTKKLNDVLKKPSSSS